MKQKILLWNDLLNFVMEKLYHVHMKESIFLSKFIDIDASFCLKKKQILRFKGFFKKTLDTWIHLKYIIYLRHDKLKAKNKKVSKWELGCQDNTKDLSEIVSVLEEMKFLIYIKAD